MAAQQAPGGQQAPAQQTAVALDLTAVHKVLLPWIEKLEAELEYPVIAYFLEDEGAPAQLADEQMRHLYEHLRRLGHRDRLGLWLLSRGGATETPARLVALIREYASWFSVLLPYRAHSAATVVALGADEIVMTEMSELGPVDPSRIHPLLPTQELEGRKVPLAISVQDLRQVLKFIEREVGHESLSGDGAATLYAALFDKIHPLAIGALEQSWTLAQQVSTQVLETHMDHETDGDRAKIKSIVDRLSDHYMSHLFQVHRREATEIGLKVRDASDRESYLMWELYQAYKGIQLEAKAQVNGEQAQGRRLGHIDSTVGASLGVGFNSLKEPTKSLGSRWESLWLVEVPEPLATPAAAPPNQA